MPATPAGKVAARHAKFPFANERARVEKDKTAALALRKSQDKAAVEAMMSRYGRLGMWRGALLGSVSLIAMISASDAEAACQGLNTSSVLCDAANPGGAGAIVSSYNTDTAVNVNAGAGITGSITLFGGASSLTFNNHDPAGINNGTYEAIQLYNNTVGGTVTYTGTGDVGPNGLRITASGAVSVTQNTGTINSVQVSTDAPGNIDINTVGSQAQFIFARKFSPVGQSDITITTGDVSSGDPNLESIYVQLGVSNPGGRNLSITTNGNITGSISASSRGTGTVDLTTNAGVTGNIFLQATNTAGTGAFMVNLNQNVTGSVTLQNSGTGTVAIRTKSIAGTFSSGGGSGTNNSIVVDGTITRPATADTSYGGTLASVGTGINGYATFNGAISGTFDASASPISTSGTAYGLRASLGNINSVSSGVLTANGPITVTGMSRPGDAANVTGVRISTSANTTGVFDVNLHGAVSATSISNTASTVYGIFVDPLGPSALRLTADGAVSASANAAGSTSTGIYINAYEFLPYTSPNTYVIRANADVTATSDGAATGISVNRGIGNSLTPGAGGIDFISKGTVTATSTSAGAIGVRSVFDHDTTNAATLS
ncbi:MAG: hypothetical protein PS018_00835, partial [bacterium]|nr:hypothetical protein [bacterium]